MKALMYAKLFLILIGISSHVFSVSEDTLYPTVIFDFVEKGPHLSGTGSKISTIIFSNLVENPSLSLVDREEMDKLEDEMSLNLSGMVNPQQANYIGQLTGAKIIVTGTVFAVEDQLMIVCKIISTETGRVSGASVKAKGNDSIVTMADQVSEKIAEIIIRDAGSLVAKPVPKEEHIAALNKQLGSNSRPKLTIDITEHHINRAANDPAAETMFTFYSIESGFEVADKETSDARMADIMITGEGFTERSARRGEIVSVKARLEVKAVDRSTQKILAVDRQTEIAIDLSEMIAAKSALEEAAAKIARRMLPKMVAR